MFKEWEMSNWQREQTPRKWRGKEVRKTEIAMEDSIKKIPRMREWDIKVKKNNR